jgi:cell division protein FtsN
MLNAPTTPTLAHPEEDVTTTLYRAVIGPVNQPYYLPIWTRFESAGRAGLAWNSAAALSTLNWLIFRKLWMAALAYAGAILGLALLLFGIGGLVFQYTETAQMSLVLGFGLALFILPGLFGNVLYYADCRKKMARALATHAQLPNACADLLQQASSRVRMMVIAFVNAIAAGLLAFSFIGFSAMKSPAVALPNGPERGNSVSGRALDLTQTPLTPITPITPITPLTPIAPALMAASSPLAAAAAPIAAPAASASAAITASAPTAPASASASAPTVSSAASQSKPAARPKQEPTKDAAPRPKPPPRSPAAAPSPLAPPTRLAPPTPLASPAKPVEDLPEQAAEVPLYYVNAGLFSNPENAGRVHSTLIQARLPSVMKALQTSKERQIRVRVGPFTSHQQAEQVAATMRTLQLEASIVQR